MARQPLGIPRGRPHRQAFDDTQSYCVAPREHTVQPVGKSQLPPLLLHRFPFAAGIRRGFPHRNRRRRSSGDSSGARPETGKQQQHKRLGRLLPPLRHGAGQSNGGRLLHRPARRVRHKATRPYRRSR